MFRNYEKEMEEARREEELQHLREAEEFEEMLEDERLRYEECMEKERERRRLMITEAYNIDFEECWA